MGYACVFKTSKVTFLKLYKIKTTYIALLGYVNGNLRKQQMEEPIEQR